jgi:serine/threonine-protein kinase
MILRLNPCDPDRLRLLAEDRLPPAEMVGLEEHLQQCAGCRKALDGLAGGESWLQAVRRYLGADPTESYEASSGLPDNESLDFLAPTDWPDSLGRLGSYEVKGMLGRGGMGVVLKAFDSSLSRNVAIKVLDGRLATCGAARRRFLREARATAAVVHEHVVSVFSVVESAGLPFLVMEYVPGRSLQDRLDAQGPLALPEILRIGMQTAAGLAAAHAQGLVHRDVKPANILLENDVERVKLTDFGLARAAADAGMTQSGVVAGTPHYMAPEQARAEATDHRADLFSLGSTLYAMCTGHPPFRAESAVAVLRRVSDDEPRPVRQINPDVPEWLEAIIAKLHAKDPAGRFQSAAELAELLSRCLAHVQEPLAVPLPPELAPPAKRIRRGAIFPWMTRRRGESGLAHGLLATASFLPKVDVGGAQSSFSVAHTGGKYDDRGPRPGRTWAVAALTGLAAIVGGVGVIALRHGRPTVPIATAQASVQPGRETFHDSPGLRPARNGTDELDHQIQDVWGKAGAIEADLHRQADPQGGDLVSTLAQSLTNQARSLERAIVAGRNAAPGSPDPSPFQPR